MNAKYMNPVFFFFLSTAHKWTTNNFGYISWSDQNRLQLVAAVKANMVLIAENAREDEKVRAWANVHQMLRSEGLPEGNVGRLKGVWTRMLNSYAQCQQDPSTYVSNVNIAMRNLFHHRDSLARQATARGLPTNAQETVTTQMAANDQNHLLANEKAKIDLEVAKQHLKCLQKQEILFDLQIKNEKIRLNQNRS